MHATSAVSSSIEMTCSGCPTDDGVADDVPEGRGRELARMAVARGATSSDWKEDKTRLNTFLDNSNPIPITKVPLDNRSPKG